MSKKMKRHLHDKKGFKNNNAVVKSIRHTINNLNCNISIAHVKVKRNKITSLANSSSK